MLNSDEIKSMFNDISNDYDKMNNLMTFGLQKIMKKSVLCKLKAKNPKKILDLCTGTGDMAILAEKMFPDSKIVAVDFSKSMLELARKRSSSIEFLEVDCTNLPFSDKEFDLCIISFGLRNIPDIEKAISEISRVVSDDGILVNIDLGKPNKFFNIFLKPYMYLWISILGKIFHGNETPYKYLAKSNENFSSPKELIEKFKNVGFSTSKKYDYFFGQVSVQISQK